MKVFFAKALLKAAWCVCFPVRVPLLLLQGAIHGLLVWWVNPSTDVDQETRFFVHSFHPHANPWVRPPEIHKGTLKWWLLSRVSVWCWNIEHGPAHQQTLQAVQEHQK
jgi:hypothetical protein